MKIAPTHDEMLIDSDGRLCGYATAVPNGTRLLAGHARPARHGRAASVRAAAGDPTAPGAEAPGPSPRPPGEGIDREHLRSMAAMQGHLPPKDLSEATYPAHWLPELRGKEWAGGV